MNEEKQENDGIFNDQGNQMNRGNERKEKFLERIKELGDFYNSFEKNVNKDLPEITFELVEYLIKNKIIDSDYIKEAINAQSEEKAGNKETIRKASFLSRIFKLSPTEEHDFEFLIFKMRKLMENGGIDNDLLECLFDLTEFLIDKNVIDFTPGKLKESPIVNEIENDRIKENINNLTETLELSGTLTHSLLKQLVNFNNDVKKYLRLTNGL